MKKERQLNIRLTDEQYTNTENKAKELGFASLSEYFRFASLNYEGNKKLSATLEDFCKPWIEPCRSYLFMIEPADKERYDVSAITAFIQSVQITEDRIVIVFILEETNMIKKFLEEKKPFKIVWLNRTGNAIDYFQVPYYKDIDIFPMRLGHDQEGISYATAIIKRNNV